MLFLNAKDLFGVEETSQNFTDELKRLLEIQNEQNLIKTFQTFHEKTGHKVVIIIDNFYNLFTINKDKSKVFESIIQWLCEIEDNKAIKMVISMRSYFWLRFQPLIRSSHYLNKKWFPGKYYDQVNSSNVPKLTITEVEAILHQIDPKSSFEINQNIKTRLRHPFYLKYYYLLKNEYNPNEFTSDVISYEIFLRFILESLYRSNLAIEKLIICKRIVQFSDYGLKEPSIDKKILLHDFIMFKQAYMDLLAEGILIESKKIIQGVLYENISFRHYHFFEYFLFKEMLERDCLIIGNHINNSFLANYHKELIDQLMKWLVFTAVRKGDYQLINMILKNGLLEQPYFSLFMKENIKHQLQVKPTDIIQIRKNINSEYLISLELINN